MVVDSVAVVVVVVDSMMELELPGEEKKKRWEVKAVMKSTATQASGSEAPTSLVRPKRGTEVELESELVVAVTS